ncbi:MAG: serine/threonine protein kinase [Bryobacterales bacterium]|nr:serine/threonine protein kinase [Bryobacterales bacterium]
METRLWKLVQEAFEQAAAMGGDERSAFLASLPDEVSRETAALLAADAEASDFLESAYVPWPREGTHIGRYVVESLVARGGMGEVYKAQRDSGFTQQVAIKVLGPAFALPDAERLFARERQILAQLSHPHIVRLLDGGVCEGRQYLVMEWVHGQRLGDWACTAGISEKLLIFEQICDAVQAAHQSLIVHCDLKPSNVIVAAGGQPKLLDFGIARLIDLAGDLPGSTHTVLRALTLSYASPEQARGLKPATPSDVYSLGLILYELVTGAVAQPVEGLPLDEAIAAIATKEPAKAHGIHRDLDAIIRMAAAKDPSRRYPSAKDLGEDVRRFRMGYPIAAHPPSTPYRLRKFAERNRGAVFAGALGLAAATLALAAFIVQYGEAQRHRGIAERRFAAARQLSQMLVMEGPQRLGSIPGTIDTRRWMAQQATRYLEQLAADAGNDEDFALDVARGYRQLAFQQYNTNVPNLNDPVSAAKSLEMGAALLERFRSRQRDTQAELVQNYIDRPYLALRRNAEAIALEDRAAAIAAPLAQSGAKNDRDLLARVWFRQASNLVRPAAQRLDLWAKLEGYYRERLSEKKEDPNRIRNLALVHKSLASIFTDAKNYERALQEDRKALALDEERQRLEPHSTAVSMDLSFDYGRLGQDLVFSGRPNGGIAYLHKSVAIRRAAAADDPQNKFVQERLAWILGELGNAYLLVSQPAEARKVLREAVAIRETIHALGIGSRSMPDLLALLAAAAVAANNPVEACRYWRGAKQYLPASTEGGDSVLPAARIEREAAACGPR